MTEEIKEEVKLDKVEYTPEDIARFDKMAEELVDNLNKNAD